MNIAERLAASLALCAAGVFICFAVAKSAKASAGVTETLCEEIAHVLNDAYIEGVISRETAIMVIDDCFAAADKNNV